MSTTNLRKFKGEIEHYLATQATNFDRKIIHLFTLFRIGSLLALSKIIKKDGYHARHLLFVLVNLPFLRLRNVHQFSRGQYMHWSQSRRDTLYRFQRNSYRWRTFLYKVVLQIRDMLSLDRIPLREKFFIVDDTILSKRGKKMENVSYVHDHNLGKSVLGYNILALGLFTSKSFFGLDFSFRFGSKRPSDSPMKIGDPRSINGQMSYEAFHRTKLNLAVNMIQRAWDKGIRAGYVLFDSWFSWPQTIKEIRDIDSNLHVICRLKKSKVRYTFKGKIYNLNELYQKVRHGLRRDSRLGIMIKRLRVQLPNDDSEVVLVFTRGYNEPEDEEVAGKKKNKEPKWVAFLSTDTSLHASTIIKHYTKRWSVEVFFKECKQMLGLGKEAARDFTSQIFSVTATWLRYNLLSFLNENENYPDTLGTLFDQISDNASMVTYFQRIWEFFAGLFHVAFSAIFELFEIEEDFSSYFDVVVQQATGSPLFNGCET